MKQTYNSFLNNTSQYLSMKEAMCIFQWKNPCRAKPGLLFCKSYKAMAIACNLKPNCIIETYSYIKLY